MNLNRRNFLKLSGKLAAVMGLSSTAIPQLAHAVGALAKGETPVLWLQGQSCSGCSVSLLNTENPGPAEFLTEYISLKFHSTLSTATGEVAMNAINQTIEKGDFFLVVEGSVPEGMPKACIIGGELFTEQLARAARKARAIVCAGTCSAFGGIPAAENNPTGSVSVPDFLQKRNINKPLIRLPGCPVHPDWIVGTVAHIAAFGLPKLDDKNRPLMFYKRIVHDQCPRFTDYEREFFATKFGEPGCLFKLGCQGPVTHADCTIRKWNGGNTHCINSGAPCIGCASEHFAHKADFPFYTKS
jgi:hydrogenase small subunit